MQHVIVGAGPAGVIAAETLRKISTDNIVKLIGDEPEQPYSRMAIPYLLVENIQEKGTHLRKDEGHYDLQGIDVIRDRVTAVDSNQRTLSLQSGSTINYDRLLICTGSSPMKPPVAGMDLDGVHNCWTLEDARNIMKLAQPGSKVLLIGAGFIGCIILEALAGRKVDLTVVEMGDRMVPRMMNQTAGNMIKRWCEHKDIKVHTSTSVTGVEQAKQPSQSGLQKVMSALTGSKAQTPTHRFKVSLDNGQTVDADLVIAAAGVKPNTALLDGSGVEIDRGILIDHFMQTNIPEIYAAGDVAQGRDFSTGEYEVHAIQPTAADHGRIAAQNMAGTETYFEGSFNMNVLDTVGLISVSFGLWMGAEGGDSCEAVDEDNFRYISLQFQDDVMVGATALGLTQHVGVLRGLIQGKVHLGEWKHKLLEDPNRIMEAYLAQNYTAQHAA
jgi:NAD(P)H-nitrite reductase large subunit